MKNVFKYSLVAVIVAVISVTSVIILFFVALGLMLVPPRPERRQAEQFLQNNKEHLFAARDYLLSLEFDSVVIGRPFVPRGGSYDMNAIEKFVGLENGRIPLEDEAMLDALYHLFPSVSVISKSGNSISFMTWSHIRDRGRGIAYSIDGNTPDNSGLTFLTHIEPLSEEGWYFYIEDFNEYRRSR